MYSFKLLSFSLLMLGSLVSLGNENSNRYSNYLFLPEYALKTSQDNLTEGLKGQLLSDWHIFERLYSFKIEDNEVYLYRAEVEKSQLVDFIKARKYKKKVLKEKLINKDSNRWDSLAFFNKQNSLLSETVGDNENEFFSNGHYSHDYYGCIESQPLFKSPLIEGQPKSAFVITASGHFASELVLDDISFSAYSSDGVKYFKEALLWSNYYGVYGEDSDKTKIALSTGLYTEESKRPVLNADDGFGRKRYGKVFIDDFDKDNYLDVVFWFKTFKSPLITDEPYFQFEQEVLTIYSENKNEDSFLKENIQEIGRVSRIIENYKLDWDKGYPSDNNLCDEVKKEYEMMRAVTK